MAAEPQKPIDGILADLPDEKELRRRIADNIQERQVLRQLLRIAEQRRPVGAHVGGAAR